ncbi:MAG: Fic family protein [Acidobacteriota bacterium]
MVTRSDYTANAPGTLTDIAGGFVAFVPKLLPPVIDWTGELVGALSAADQAVGQLAGVGRTLPNPHLLIRPFLQKEAVLSSRIEGTKASLSDLLLFDIEPAGEPQVADTREVRNYVLALEHGLRRVETLPIGTRLICELHQILLDGVRGDAGGGELRRLQVHIGASGRMSQATFIPAPANEIPQLLSGLEHFIHDDKSLPALIRMALTHYQFEAIHPFHDGNGRIGRLLISLLLCTEGLLSEPLLYLSAYFEKNRSDYYRYLREVSTHGRWNQWLIYFLEGVRQQSHDAIATANRLAALRTEFHERLHAPRATGLLHKLVDALFVAPATTIAQSAALLGVTYRSAQQNVGRLVESGILREVTGQKRNRIFISDEIVRAVEGTR